MRPIQKKSARVNSRNKKGTPAQILEILKKKQGDIMNNVLSQI